MQGERRESGERLERRRQVVGGGLSGAVDEEREDGCAGVQGKLDLATHEVGGVVEPAQPVVVRGGEPARPDHHEHDDAGPQGLFQAPGEELAPGDGVDVEEDVAPAQARHERAGEHPADVTRVVATVRDEDGAHRRHSPGGGNGRR